MAVASVMVTGYSYIDTNGAAIQCMMDKGAQIPEEVINKWAINFSLTIASTYKNKSYPLGFDRPNKTF